MTIADRFAADATHKVVASTAVSPWMAYHGHRTREYRCFRQALESAQTIDWNGTLGVAEMPPFAKGIRRDY